METKELKIQIPEGYEIDKKNSSFEKIVFKKIDTKPRSWEEYRAKVDENKLYKVWGLVEGEELADTFLAMMKLMSLRQAWIHNWSLENELTKDWEPDWNKDDNKHCIIIFDNEYIVDQFSRYHQVLSFPTNEMTTDFMETFKDLLEIAKPLI